ncbi:MAG: GNAT family N-acetyltransferase [Nitrolancea sp.]
MHIREMRPDDREFILALTERLEGVGSPPWRDPDKMREFHKHYAEETVGASADDQAVYIAHVESRERLGFIHVLEINDGLTGEREAYVATLAVTAAASGRGIGRALMDRAEQWTRDRGLTIVTLEVFAQNEGARRFYDRLGYQEETLKLVKVLSTSPD